MTWPLSNLDSDNLGNLDIGQLRWLGHWISWVSSALGNLCTLFIGKFVYCKFWLTLWRLKVFSVLFNYVTSKFLGATFVSTERKFDFANWVIIFHIAKPDNPVTLLGQIMGGSVVAFGLHSVCQIFVFFILTLFVVDNKMVGNTVCWFQIFTGNITGDFQKP